MFFFIKNVQYDANQCLTSSAPRVHLMLDTGNALGVNQQCT